MEGWFCLVKVVGGLVSGGSGIKHEEAKGWIMVRCKLVLLEEGKYR